MLYTREDTNTVTGFRISDFTIPNRNPKSWLGSILVALILVALYFLLSSTNKLFTTDNAEPMKTYTDSLHYVKLRVPTKWTAEQEVATNTTGLNTPNPVTQQVEISQLYVPKTEGITIQVYNGTPTCPLDQPLTTKLAGFPAAHDDTFNTWTIPANKATVTVSITYPGSVIHVAPENAPTAPEPSVVELYKSDVMDVLNTMELNNLTPFSCS